MSICVIGINHKTAPVAWREKLYFALDKLPLYLHDLLAQGHAREAVLLSTCNRSEIYCETDDLASVCDWFCAQTTLQLPELQSALYVHQQGAAVAHIMQVACGLDSMMLGETQILGQMKEAFSESCAAGAVGSLFHRLFQHVFAVAKEIRTATAIGACPVSVASAAVHFAKQQLAGLQQAKAALIGAGEMAALLMLYLKSHLTQPVIVINRDTEKAKVLSAPKNAQVYGLHELALGLKQADIVFSATGSVLPIVTQALMTEVMEAREGRPLILIDIAVPRDIESSVAKIAGVSLYCIDDLKNIIEKNRQGREHAADKAREKIVQKSADILAELQSLANVAHTIRAYRSQVEAICRAELIKAQQQLAQGADPVQVLDLFAHAFTNKLLHAPSVQLRQAGVEGRFEILKWAKQLFAIPDPEVKIL